MNSGRMQDSSSESIDAQHGGNVNKTVVEVSERTLSVLAFGLAVAAFVVALWSIHESDRSARETKQLQIQVMDQNALMIREGFKQPGDTVYGPAGNLEYKHKEKR